MFAATSPTCCLSIPADVEQRRPLHREGDACRGRHDDRVREAERELKVGPLLLNPITGAGDLQGLSVTLGHPDDHVGDEGTAESVQFLGPPFVVGAVDLQLAVRVALEPR